MADRITVLLIDDSEDAAHQVMRILQMGGFNCEFERIETISNLKKTLSGSVYDAIIINKDIRAIPISMVIAVIHDLANSIPYIIISKDMNEKAAVDLMGDGAAGFIIRDNLALLAPVTRRVLKESHTLREKQETANALLDSTRRFKILFEQSPFGIVIFDPTTRKPLEFNNTVCSQLGYTRDEFSNLTIKDFEVYESPKEIDRHVEAVLHHGFDSFDTKHRTKQGEERSVHVSVQPLTLGETTYLHCIYEDVTDRIKAEEQTRAEKELLEICGFATSTRELMKNLLAYFAKISGCEAVGIRLKEGDDFPYYETRGLPESFFKEEKSLCLRDKNGEFIRDADGNPILECMCGNVLCGRINPEKDFFTEHGSFWSGNTSKLLAESTDADRMSHTRNRCNREGYESVALIPLKHQGKIFGLFQFNDRRIGWHTREKVDLLEHLVDYVAITLAKQEADNALAASEQNFKEIFNSTSEAIFIHDAETGEILDVNDTVLKMYGFSSKEEAVSNNKIQMLQADAMFSQERGREIVINANFSGPRVFEWLSKKTDGSQFWAEISLNKSLINGKERILAVVRDISERKRMEEALSYSEERYRLLFTEMAEGFALHEIILNKKGKPVDYRFLDVNPAFEKLTGLKRDEIIGHTVKEVLPVTEPYWIEKYGEVALNGGNLQYENYSAGIGKWYNVIAFCPKIGQFAVTFEDITDRKRNDASLRESEEQFRSTFEQTAIGMCMVTIDGQFIRINQAFCQLTGYSSEELIGNSIDLITHPEDRHTSQYYLKNPLDGGSQNFQFEKRYIHKSGRLVWVILSSTLVKDGSGNPRYFISQVQDITERKNAEEALHLRDKIFTHSLDLLFVGGYDGYFKILNPAWEYNLGWTLDELTAKPWIDFVYPEDKDATRNINKSLVENGREVLQFENRYFCKDGTIRWLSWNAYPYPDESLIVGVARDVTEKKEMDESLRKSEERYHLIDEASSDHIYSLDRQGCFTHVNSALCKDLGLSMDEIIGKNISELGFSPEDSVIWEQTQQKVYATNDTVFTERIDSTHSEQRYLEVVLNPMHNENGEIIGIAGTTRDITDRKIAEIKIKEQMDELKRWNTVTLGRENRILELKQEVNNLLSRLNEPQKYKSGMTLENNHDR